MIQVLRTTYPRAKKEHLCMYCGCKIEVGEVYMRQTNIFDNEIYDWVCHKDCDTVAQELDMFDFCDEGLTDDHFRENINDYIGNELAKTDEDTDRYVQMSYLEKARAILNHIEQKGK